MDKLPEHLKVHVKLFGDANMFKVIEKTQLLLNDWHTNRKMESSSNDVVSISWKGKIILLVLRAIAQEEVLVRSVEEEIT